MRKYNKFLFVIFLVSVLLMAGLSVQAKTYHWRFAHQSVEGSLRDITANEFKEYVEKETDGQVKVDIYPNATLGTEPEQVESLQMGSLDLSVIGYGGLVNYVPEDAATSLPFLFASYEEAHALLDGKVGDIIKEKAAEKGFEILAFMEMGFCQMTNNVRPITHPDDLAGVKMRCPNVSQFVSIMKQLGSNPSTLPYSELYLGLDQGVVDGQFNPINAIYETKFFEVQDYLSYVNMLYAFGYVIMNKGVYDSLDPDLQKIVQEGAYKGAVKTREMLQEVEENAFAKMKDNFKEISYPELEPFRTKVAPVYDEFRELAGKEVVDEILAAVAEYRSK